MKLLIHINSLGLGGAERVASILAEYLTGRGHQVLFATEWQDKEEYPLPPEVMRIHAGLEPEVSSGRLSAAYARLKHLRRIIQAEKPDLVLSFMKKANYRAAFALSFLSVPLVISVRNDPAVDYSARAAGLLNAVMKKKAAGGVFQTHAAMDFFGREFASRSRVILNPVEERFFQASWEGGEERIVSIGRLTSQKNQLLLIRAFARIADKLPHRLELYGAPDPEGKTASELKQYVQEQGLEQRVFFMGTTAHPEKVLKTASCFVLSSDYEGLPNALLEALCMGVPCISTDCPCGGPAEVIKDQENGLLTPVGDEEALAKAILAIVSDKACARRLSENALRLKERFSRERICGEWEEFLKKC